MSGLHPNQSLTRFCLLAAAAMPIIYIGTEVAAAPFYPGYSFSQQSESMLGTHFSKHPGIFNVGLMLAGFAALVGAFGLYRSFRARNHPLPSLVLGLSVACTGVLCIRSGMFPMPDPRHNSWGFLHYVTFIMPFLMLVGLSKQSHSSGLRAYLAGCMTFLVILGLLIGRGSQISWLARGTVQRLISLATFVPIGVVGFFFWRELHRESPD
ncbi:MAG TPA: DUF998 domain-containing protein [Candidatus Acidoferrales bacterium]